MSFLLCFESVFGLRIKLGTSEMLMAIPPSAEADFIGLRKLKFFLFVLAARLGSFVLWFPLGGPIRK